MLKRLGRAIFQARWNVLVVGLILVMIAAVFGTGVLGVLKSGGFYDPNSESTKAEKLLNEKLGGASADVGILMCSQKLKATDRAFARAAQNLIARLKRRPEVRTILSYYSTHDQTFLSKDRYETFALIQLTAADETRKEQDYCNIQSLMKAPPLQVMIAGTVPVNIAFNQLVNADLEHAEIFTFPIVALRTGLVDKVVWNEVCQLLKRPERFEQEYQRLYKDAISDLCRINDKIEKLRQGRIRLIDSYAEGLIDKTEFEPCITRMGEQIKHLEEQYQSIKNKTGLGKGLSQLLGSLNDFSSHVKVGLDAVDWFTRREIIQTVVKRVEINQEQVRVVFRVGPSTLFSPLEKTFPRYATV